MKISGGTILGNCATGSPSIVTKPTMTVMIAITMATMGRLMKNLYMAYGNDECRMSKPERNPNVGDRSKRAWVRISDFGFPSDFVIRHSSFLFRYSSLCLGGCGADLGGKRLRFDDRFFAHFLQSFHDDAVAGFQPILDDPLRVGSLAHLDGLDVDLIFVPDDCDLIGALQFGDGALRH